MLREFHRPRTCFYELVVEWALDPAFFEGRDEFTLQTKLGSAFPAEYLYWSCIFVFVFTEAVSIRCKVCLQRTKAFGTIFWLVKKAFLVFVEVGSDLDFRVISLEGKSHILVIEDIEGKLIGVTEFILRGIEYQRQVNLMLDDSDGLGIVRVRWKRKSNSEKYFLFILLRHSEILIC